jgi:hypothetical protein
LAEIGNSFDFCFVFDLLFNSSACSAKREKKLLFFSKTHSTKKWPKVGQFILSISDFGQKLRPKEEPVPSSHDKLNTRTNILFQNFLNNLDFLAMLGEEEEFRVKVTGGSQGGRE